MKRNTIGLIFIGLGVLALPVILAGYALSNFLIASQIEADSARSDVVTRCLTLDGSLTEDLTQCANDEGSEVAASEPDMRAAIGNVINLFLGFLGILAVPGFVGIGLYFLVTDPKKQA